MHKHLRFLLAAQCGFALALGLFVLAASFLFPPAESLDFVHQDYRLHGKRVTLAEAGANLGGARLTAAGLYVCGPPYCAAPSIATLRMPVR